MNAARPAAAWVAGVDGCRGGWFAVLRRLDGSGLRGVRLDRFSELRAPSGADEGALAVVAVDMVIGLPDAATPGGRACDRAARAYLGHPRGSSVFSPPSRPALAAATYAEAARRNRASSPAALGLSTQAFHLFPKIRELDAVLRAGAAPGEVYETHPEVAFAALDGGAALAEGKRTAAGRRRRLALLEGAGFDNIAAFVEAHRGAGVRADDVVDACVCCWTAARLAQGAARHLPAVIPPAVIPTDACGLPMAIWF